MMVTAAGNMTQVFISVQISHSVVSDSLGPHELQHARPPCPSPTPRIHPNSCPSSRWCHPAISSSVVPFSPAPNPSQHQRLFQWVNSSNEVAKVLEFQLYIIPSKEHPGLISFRMDWLDLLAVQGTLKSLLQHYSSKTSLLRRSGFFTVQLSHPYMTTGKTIALTRRTFVGKVMSLLLNIWETLRKACSTLASGICRHGKVVKMDMAADHLARSGATPWCCDHSPRARHPGMQSQVGLRKHHYQQS